MSSFKGCACMQEKVQAVNQKVGNKTLNKSFEAE